MFKVRIERICGRCNNNVGLPLPVDIQSIKKTRKVERKKSQKRKCTKVDLKER